MSRNYYHLLQISISVYYLNLIDMCLCLQWGYYTQRQIYIISIHKLLLQYGFKYDQKVHGTVIGVSLLYINVHELSSSLRLANIFLYYYLGS